MQEPAPNSDAKKSSRLRLNLSFNPNIAEELIVCNYLKSKGHRASKVVVDIVIDASRRAAEAPRRESQAGLSEEDIRRIIRDELKPLIESTVLMGKLSDSATAKNDENVSVKEKASAKVVKPKPMPTQEPVQNNPSTSLKINANQTVNKSNAVVTDIDSSDSLIDNGLLEAALTFGE